jgi:cobalt-zinc-cadmium efflux system membrane fusion protein
MKRRLQLGCALGAVVIAATTGFVAGHMQSVAADPPAKIDAPQANTAPAEPPLPAGIDVSPQEMQNMQLHTARAETRPLVRQVPAIGVVGYDELHVARITSPARGRIEALEVVVGDQVHAGQPLALVDNFDLSEARSRVASAQAQLVQASAEASAAQAAVARASELVHTGGMAQSELERRRADAARTQAELRTRQAELQQWQDAEQRLMPIDAAEFGSGVNAPANRGPRDSQGAIVTPFNGMVDAVAVSPGELVDTSKQIFTVADLSTVWLQADVAESDVGTVRVGDAVTIRMDAYPDRTFTGRVSYIADQIDPQTGTAKIRCEVPNPDGALRVNMFANVAVAAPLGRNAILVPNSALQTVNNQSVVFIPIGSGHFAWRAVQTGLVSGSETEFTGGLEAGAKVVTDGSYWLKAALMRDTIPDEG